MRTAKQLLGARVKELRKGKGITQDQLAERVGLATRYISMIEVGRSSPSLETVENIARALDVQMKVLFDFAHLDPEATSPEGLDRHFEGVDENHRQLLFRIASIMKE